MYILHTYELKYMYVSILHTYETYILKSKTLPIFKHQSLSLTNSSSLEPYFLFKEC